MAKTIGYLRRNSKVQQRNEFSATKDERGHWSCNYVFVCRDTDAISLTPAIGDPCPRWGLQHLEFVGATLSSLPNQPYTKVVCNYQGTDSDNDGGGGGDSNGNVYTSTFSSASDPIESHIKFEDLSEDELNFIKKYKNGSVMVVGETTKKYYISEKTQSSYERKKEVAVSGALEELIKLLNKGVTTYYSPRIDFSHEYVSRRSSNIDSSKVGKIDTPPSQAPNIDGDWLFMGGEQRKVGSSYHIRKTWKSSASGGWLKYIYKN